MVVMTMMLVIIMIGEKDCSKGRHERNLCSGQGCLSDAVLVLKKWTFWAEDSSMTCTPLDGLLSWHGKSQCTVHTSLLWGEVVLRMPQPCSPGATTELEMMNPGGGPCRWSTSHHVTPHYRENPTVLENKLPSLDNSLKIFIKKKKKVSRLWFLLKWGEKIP